MARQENPLSNIFFNILAPVLILNKMESYLPEVGSVVPLLVALSFPIAYGLRDYFRNNKNKNFLSLFGIVNILLSGGFALFTLEGIWFAVKETAFPLLIGICFLISSWRGKPLMSWLVNKSTIFKTNLIQTNIDTPEKKQIYQQALRTATNWMAYCFFFSAFLNFVLAFKIFVLDFSRPLSVSASSYLNEKIADMTWVSFLVIGLPLSIVSGCTLWWFVNQIKKITHLKLEDMLNVDIGNKVVTKE